MERMACSSRPMPTISSIAASSASRTTGMSWCHPWPMPPPSSFRMVQAHAVSLRGATLQAPGHSNRDDALSSCVFPSWLRTCPGPNRRVTYRLQSWMLSFAAIAPPTEGSRSPSGCRNWVIARRARASWFVSSDSQSAISGTRSSCGKVFGSFASTSAQAIGCISDVTVAHW